MQSHTFASICSTIRVLAIISLTDVQFQDTADIFPRFYEEMFIFHILMYFKDNRRDPIAKNLNVFKLHIKHY